MNEQTTEEQKHLCKWHKCLKPIENIPGHREKVFCSRLCKQKQWQKDHPKGNEYVKMLKSEYDLIMKTVMRRLGKRNRI